MVRVQQRLGVSERRACEVLGQARSTQRRSRKRGADETALRADVVKVAGRFGRYGYRMVTGMLRAEGWVVNHKRVEADLGRGGPESAQETAQTGPALVDGRLMHPASTLVPPSRLGV